ncbi:TIGR03885 family FMN-dependent LLM class oxidoreductase [Terrihabitans sp. B22-R8]|uniref:TIGR03885 family FMN-dependent LLM class oxidoreductase n=1 Tax=Terrihabitans sp. B22-R8 TaxID=3425128 RepID=UPI00403CA19B
MAVRIGYHASHEQFSPRDLLRHVQEAEEAGFACAMSSEHFAPWSERQGQSGFAYSWMGAALQATSLPMGMLSIPMNFRFHPAIVAQAGATLAQMFPGRFRWMALGTGEALNEHILAEPWPDKAERTERLRAAVDIIRALFRGETVSCDGPIPTDEARLYTLPETPPLLFGAALTPKTAEWAGGWADGLAVINQPIEKLQEMIAAFRRGGGAGKPIALQVHLSYAASDGLARANAFDQWRSNVMTPDMAANYRMPREFDQAAENVRPEDLDQAVLISSDLDWHLERLRDFAALGFEEIYLHNVGRNQSEFVRDFGRDILPALGQNVPKTADMAL